jgi:MOSC domain-containing protein YiiM
MKNLTAVMKKNNMAEDNKLRIGSAKTIVQVSGECPFCETYLEFHLHPYYEDTVNCNECGKTIIIDLDGYDYR